MTTCKRSSFIVGVLLFFSSIIVSPSIGKELKTTRTVAHNYVVIGAFSLKSNAIKYVAYTKQFDFESAYELHPPTNLYYVYAYKFADKSSALKEAKRIQQIEEFADTWVYIGELGGTPRQAHPVAISPDDGNTSHSSSTPTLQESPSSKDAGVTSDNGINDGSEKADITDVPDIDSLEVMKDSSEVALEGTLAIGSENPKRISGLSPISKNPEPQEETVTAPEEKTYKVYINTVHVGKFKEVKGTVEVIDPIRDKKIGDIEAHTLSQFGNPKNGNNSVKFDANIFGFKPVEYVIDLENPTTDSTAGKVEVLGDSIIVNFDMQRYQKGDIIVLYRVYFFKDAAIMRPESKYELNSLLDMLLENEDMIIKIHGHTNGNSHGKIISLGSTEDNDFFALSAVHKEGIGSAKKLSEYRAGTLKQYLISKGIDEKRLQVKGWGGKKMLYDKHSSQAKKNVRVEVEILQD